MAHESLVFAAHSLLLENLTRYGNQIGPGHSAALKALCQDMTDLASGTLKGRWAWGLGTGLGKSASVVAWISALYRMGKPYGKVSVAVSASTVEALCELQRELIASGVPADDVGLVHSYIHSPAQAALGTPGHASEPSTGHDRRFLLVTHQRCRSSSLAFNLWKGKPRSLLIYDESLLCAAPIGLPLGLTLGSIDWYLNSLGGRPKYKDLLAYLSQVRSFLASHISRLKKSGKPFRIVTIPPTDKAEEWSPLLSDSDAVSSVRDLLELAGRSARLTQANGGGVLSYQIEVPKELANVLVLDASWPVRILEQADKSIRDATERHPFLVKIIPRIKTFPDVTIHQMHKPGGRESISKAFSHDSSLVHEVAQVISRVPKGESVLVVTYKRRANGVDFAKEIRGKLSGTFGINLDEKDTATGRPRFCFATWGQECGSNHWNHCKNVVLVGVLHRSNADLMASLVGQADDLSLPVDSDKMRDVSRSERCHLVYQSLSRGSCRMVKNGKASPMNAWLIDRDKGLKAELSKVLPGASWETWTTTDDSPSIINDAAGLIAYHLERLSVDKLSTKQLKKETNLSSKNIPPTSFTTALHKALDRCPGWVLHGRSVVKVFPHATAS